MDLHVVYLALGITIISILSTAIYYFARYYVKTHEDDQEVIKSRQASGSLEGPVDLQAALSSTKGRLLSLLSKNISGEASLAEDLEHLEESLYEADLGPTTVRRLISAISQKMNASEKTDLQAINHTIKQEMSEIFKNVPAPQLKGTSTNTEVWMIVGVNGAGKTTSIGKLAHRQASLGQKVLVAAGDTFRAAAGEQLKNWTDKAQVEIFESSSKDPSAVAYEALKKAEAQGYDLLIVDTAGRLHTQDHLMEELKKMKRVLSKLQSDTPQETLIVLDANSGQNAVAQARQFNECLKLTGAILTKLDGSAKGGVAVSVACELGLPIRMIGVGEGIKDLRPFAAEDFVDSII